MTTYALRKISDNTLVRYQDWNDVPPILHPNKNLVWVQEDRPVVAVEVPTVYEPTAEEIKLSRLMQLEDACRNYVECKGDLSRTKGRIHFTASPLVFAKGSANKQKSKAIMDWCYLVWGLYYQRLAALNAGGVWNDNLLDFSSCGEMPHTIQEAMVE
jgi:hypothetical protein